MGFILDIIFPQKCGICGKISTVLCENCKNTLEKHKINLEKENIVKLDNKNIKVKEFYIFKYEGMVRKLLINYKFNDNSYLADMFSKIILDNKKICRFLKNYDIIVPVPLHKKRKLERGYNQVELIAKKLENIKLEITSLVKVRNIKPQSTKNVKDRILDIKGVYNLENIEKIKGKRILLFDDIYTTGSTINECVKVLGKYTNEIGVLILAKDYMEVRN